jgi:hypothetical protein
VDPIIMRIGKFGHILILLLLLSSYRTNAQNFIGMTKDQIILEMNTTGKNFKLNTGAINPYYNYLKYEDSIDEITILFFLSEDDICTLVRKMCDYANINDEIGELNKKYKRLNKDKWTYSSKGKSYLITLEESEWYFTITTKQKN